MQIHSLKITNDQAYDHQLMSVVILADTSKMEGRQKVICKEIKAQYIV